MTRNRNLISVAAGVLAAVIIALAIPVGGALGVVISTVLGIAVYLGVATALGGVPMGTDGAGRVDGRSHSEPGGVPALVLGLPLPVILIDRSSRILLMNEAARGIFGDVVAETPLSTVIRARPLGEAIDNVQGGGASASVDFTLMRARERRDLVAHLRRFDEGPGRGRPSVMILLEDHTRAARVEQMRRDFVANASHELRTPLASIAGFIETLRGPAAGDSGAQERFLPIMAAQADRMARLIDDLISLNRIEMNEHVRPSEMVNLGAIVHETVAAMAPLAEQAEVEIKLEVPREGLDLTGDRDELSQLFTNLIDNAIKYGGDGGEVRITLAKPEPGRRRMTGICVADKGQGVAREHLQRLTERFYQVSQSRSGKPGDAGPGGTGLGLSIVKHILSRHRGDLAIHSSPGEGTQFTAWLPRAEDSAEP
ncbi:MAG: HAMP domain-containing histidine kinase [Paracoccaceae bacterium]|nr:HAMP domain-containing histidine kinase [Paracoccaceae bacterium]